MASCRPSGSRLRFGRYLSRGMNGRESGGNGEEWSPTAEVGNLLSGEIIIMARNRSMARSDLRSRLETASCTMHTPYPVSSASLKASPPACVHACMRACLPACVRVRLRACVRACVRVSCCAQERILARGYGESLLSRSSIPLSKPPRAWPGQRQVHTGIYPLAR